MAITMTSPAPLFRNFSNKENGTFAITSPLNLSSYSTSTSGPSTHKPRVGGIGKAPKRSSGSHSAKPYGRSSSIARVKGKGKAVTLTEEESKSKRASKRFIPSPIITTAPIPRPIVAAPQPQIRIANIPVRLPRPRIPSVQSLPGDMSHIVSHPISLP